MTFRERVLKAKSPRDALLLLADAIDRLETQPTLDTWAGWSDDESTQPWDDAEAHDQAQVALATQVEQRAADAESRTHHSPVDPNDPTKVLNSNGEWVDRREVTDDEVIRWIGKNYGRTPTDDDDGRALVAMVREDLERAGKGEVAPADFVMHDGIIESQIDFSPRDDAYRQQRYNFAKDVLQLEMALGPHPEPDGDWAADYAKQGPLPLYILNRDLLVQYPDGVKAAMIADVNNYSPKIAYEMGADILKQPMTNNRDNPAMAGSWTADREQGFVS